MGARVLGDAPLSIDPFMVRIRFLDEGAVVFRNNYLPDANAAELSFAGAVVIEAASDLFLEIASASLLAPCVACPATGIR